MVNSSAFAQALRDCAARDLVDLEALQVQCLAKITGGGGEIGFTLSAGLNGKAASQECRYDAAELLTIINLALSLPPSVEGEAVGVTYADFSGLR